MRLWCAAAPLLAVLVLGFGSPAGAAPITVGYAGVIDSVNDPDGLLPGISVGMSFQGTYPIDADQFAFSSEAFGPGSGIFEYTGGPGLHSIDIEGSLFSQDIDRVWIVDDRNVFAPVVDGWAFPVELPPGQFAPLLSLGFEDSTAQRISDPLSFFVNTSLTGWDSAGISLAARPTFPTILATGVITELTVIPEPSIALLLGLGLASLALRQERSGRTPRS